MFYQGFVILQIMSLDGVLTYRHPHIWNHTSSKIHGTLHVQVSTEVSEQKIVAQVGTQRWNKRITSNSCSDLEGVEGLGTPSPGKLKFVKLQ